MPIKALKVLISLGSGVSVLLGLGTVGLALFFLVENLGIWAPSQEKYRDILASALAICGLVSFTAGIVGVLGAKRKSHCLLSLYTLVSAVMFLAFLGISAGLLVVPRTMLDEPCDSGTAGWMQDMRNFTQLAKQRFCITQYCYVTRQFNSSEMLALQQIGFKSNMNTKNPVKVQAQDDWPAESSAKLAAEFMESLESFFQCSGWCQTGFYYSFSDVNKKPRRWGGCFEEMRGFVMTRGSLIAGVCVVIAVLIGANVALICCLLRHPHNRFEKSYYQRFVVHADD